MWLHKPATPNSMNSGSLKNYRPK